MLKTKRHINLLLLLAAGLLAACSPEEPPQPEAQDEICLNTDVQKMIQRAPSRAMTYDNGTALQTEGSFTCVAYNANTTTAYIPSTTVDWNSTSSQWEFNHGSSHYYWPLPPTNGGSYPSLDFFAYMPATAPYINTISYTAAHNVTFTCTNLPMTNAGQDGSLKEFIYGMALGKNKDNASAGVPLQFQHPFAKIILELSASHPDIYIDSIKLKSVKNNGAYAHNGTPSKWTLDGTAKNFVITLNQSFNSNPASPLRQIGTSFLMIPQSWAGEIEVVAGWTDWGETLHHRVTATVPTTWEAGHCYTYTFTITEHDMVVNTTKFTEQW